LGQECILNFHGIGTPHGNVTQDESFYWLTGQTFTAVLESVAEVRASARIPITITFDDGNISDALIALPELVKFNLRAKFFVCSARIGAPHYLDSAALVDLLAAGMEIGTHGRDHQNWRGLDEAALAAELADARRRIEDVCQIAVTKAAIPFGSYDRRVLGRLRRERFECVYTSDQWFAQSSAWLKPRYTVNCKSSAQDIIKVITTQPSLNRRLLQHAAMIYKRLR